MPTTEQLLDIWDFQLHFFGGSGEPKQTFEASDESALTTPKMVDTPIVGKTSFQHLSGKVMGEYRYDEENEDLIIHIPNP